jgi:hypothetical protein
VLRKLADRTGAWREFGVALAIVLGLGSLALAGCLSAYLTGTQEAGEIYVGGSILCAFLHILGFGLGGFLAGRRYARAALLNAVGAVFSSLVLFIVVYALISGEFQPQGLPFVLGVFGGTGIMGSFLGWIFGRRPRGPNGNR